jgi:4-amino-4-deoxy-L-arabinose transferase-like glycosyltransferase
LTRTIPSIRIQLRRHIADLIALALAVIGVFTSAWVTQNIFEGVPHIEDEIAYVWQAKALLNGHLTVPSPPDSKSFLVPFIVDYHGLRFGKYPPGWPAVLAVAIGLGVRLWINPLLAGLGVWLTYRLGKRIFNDLVGLLAAGLTVTSPFFLMNSGSLLSHPLGLVLSATFALGWLGSFWDDRPEIEAENTSHNKKRWAYAALSVLALGGLILTRPMTALAVAIPFGIHGIYLLIRGDSNTRLRLVVFGLGTVAFLGAYLLWQYALTGNALLNPYTLWWPYDRVGFGPGHGRGAAGNTWQMVRINTRTSLYAGRYDLFGWAGYSWIFLPFGIWASRRNPKGLLIGSVALSLVLTYMTYWIGATLYGPRYYYEGLYSVTLLSAVGIAWLAGWPSTAKSTFVHYQGWRKLRPLAVTLLVGVLVGINLVFYLPARLNSMINLYDISRADQAAFQSAAAQTLTPALVIVHTKPWMEYGALLDLENPELTSPFIFAWSISPPVDAALARDFPNRTVYHYYPGQSQQLFSQPLPNPN